MDINSNLSRSVVLQSAAEKLISSNTYDIPTLSFIHDYLESRLSLIRTIEVRSFSYGVLDIYNNSE